MPNESKASKTSLSVDLKNKNSSPLNDNALVPTSASPSPLTTSLGGRVRKATQMFTFTETKNDEADEFSPPVGRGVKIRDIEFVKNNIEALGKTQTDTIKQLYSIMFGRRFQQKKVKVIKEHLLDFSGIVEQDEKSRENLIAKMGKWKLGFVHEIMDILAVDRSKKSFDEEGKPHVKEALLERLVDWLYNPLETKCGEKKAALAAKKAKQKANKRAKAARKADGEPAKKKQKTVKKAKRASEDEDDRGVTESESEEESSDYSEELKRETSQKKSITSRSKKLRVEESEEDDEKVEETNDDIENEETQVPAEREDNAGEKKLDSDTTALDADVCSKIRDIIANGNAEELTVKKIVQQLSDDLGRDMSAQKKAIKEFITNDQTKVQPTA